MKKDYKIPFDKNGNLLNYPDGWTQVVEWRENTTVSMIIYISAMQRGRSAAYFIAEEVGTGRKFPIFMTDLLEMIQEHTITQGRLETEFTFCKRGTNYGLKLADK